MDTVAIRRMHTRYRLPDGSADLRPRLDAIRTGLMEGALEAALAQARTGADEEVCVRSLRVAVRLRGARGDAALAADWAAAISQALTETLAKGGDQAVRYGSRMHAWLDCALGVAHSDLRRAWAWRRLGLWQGTDQCSPGAAATALTQGLAMDPSAVVPVLVGLAVEGALVGLADRLDGADWVLLAISALDAHAAPRGLLSPPAPAGDAAPGQAGTGDPDTGPPGPADLGAADPLAGSPLLALRGLARPDRARALAVLILLAADPALGRLGLAAAQVRVEALVRGLSGRAAPEPTHAPESGPKGFWDPKPVAPAARTAEPAGERARPDRPASDSGDQGQPAPAPTPPERPATDRDPWPPGSPRAAGSDADPAAAPPAAPDPAQTEAEPESPLAQRRRARTDWGGLLLLLNVLGPAGVLDMPSPLPPARTLRWSLHRLAQALAPVAPDDPAALAFAGLAPGSRPPSLDAPAPSAPELAAIAALRERVALCLHAALGAGAEDPESVLARVCRRPAEILADPGWIEVRFPLARVATEVRRAGLDLNPDWLPWLGAVVRFSYE